LKGGVRMDRARSIDLICVHSDRTVWEWLVHVQIHIDKPPLAIYPNGWSYTNTYDVTIVLLVDTLYIGK